MTKPRSDTLFHELEYAAIVREVSIAPFKRAIDIAFANGFEPVRFVLSRRVSRRLGSPIEKIYGIPVQVDEETDEGFGLITRSGSAPS